MAETAATRRLDELEAEAEAAVGAAAGPDDLEAARVRYLGRKSELTATLRSIRELPPEERGPVGQAANTVKQALESAYAARAAVVRSQELASALERERIDVTLPGRPPAVGALHPITQTIIECVDILRGMGFLTTRTPDRRAAASASRAQAASSSGSS